MTVRAMTLCHIDRDDNSASNTISARLLTYLGNFSVDETRSP